MYIEPKIIYIQKYIYKYKEDYVIIDKDLSKLFNINIKEIINKNKKIFNEYYLFNINNNYLIKKEGIILISIIINAFNIIDITSNILDTIITLEKINMPILSKLSQEEF